MGFIIAGQVIRDIITTSLLLHHPRGIYSPLIVIDIFLTLWYHLPPGPSRNSSETH